ncbi:MAG: M48 family metalloprotease [Cyanobacteria bacterium J06607_10]
MKLAPLSLKRLLLISFLSAVLTLMVGTQRHSLAQVERSPDSAEIVVEGDASHRDMEPSDVEAPNDEEAATEEATTEESVAEESVAEESATEESATEESAAEETNTEETDAAERPTETERFSRKLMLQADSEYLAGNHAAAEALYREAKNESWLIPFQLTAPLPEPFSDPAKLTPAGGVYWREAQSGIENDRLSQTLTALDLLTSEFPEFTPGVAQYAQVLQANERGDDAIAMLEEALTLYPANPDLLLTQVDVLMDNEQWIEATIASRQFVALNEDHPAAPQQRLLAEENLGRFQSETREVIRNGAIANVFTGVLGYAFTGSIFGPFTAANSAVLLLQGENAVGQQYANQIEQQLPMLQHPEAVGYVRELGRRLSLATGRSDLDYEFFVILDPNLNAFALPGGKIFVNAGAILKTNSEAELAGLLSHELSHSVLSHGFQLATQSNLTSSLTQYLPYGGIINNVFLSGYSRQMERQADIVGTQILAASRYAADGVYNVMVTLNEEAGDRTVPTWIASHPNPEDRVGYLQTIVERGGYNRYAYEGVASHEAIQTIVARELAAYEAEQAAENGEQTIEGMPDEESGAQSETQGETQSETQGEERTDLYEAVDRFDW